MLMSTKVKLMIKIHDHERLDDIQRAGYKIIQDPTKFCFGIDAVLLAHFISGFKPNFKVLDIGTGTGIIPLLLYAIHGHGTFLGIDIQSDMVEMARRTMELNNLTTNIIDIQCQDIKNFAQNFSPESFNIITCNPPYIKYNAGLQNDAVAKTISRHEVACTLEDIIQASYFILKDKGQLFFIHRANRLVDILSLMRKHKIEPKQIRLVYPKINKEPTMVLVRGSKNSGQELRVDPPLIVYNEDNSYTDEICTLYKK